MINEKVIYFLPNRFYLRQFLALLILGVIEVSTLFSLYVTTHLVVKLIPAKYRIIVHIF